MKIDREEDECFYFRFVYVIISHSANKGIYMDRMQNSGQKYVEYLWLQQLAISHIKALYQSQMFSQPCQ